MSTQTTTVPVAAAPPPASSSTRSESAFYLLLAATAYLSTMLVLVPVILVKLALLVLANPKAYYDTARRVLHRPRKSTSESQQHQHQQQQQQRHVGLLTMVVGHLIDRLIFAYLDKTSGSALPLSSPKLMDDMPASANERPSHKPEPHHTCIYANHNSNYNYNHHNSSSSSLDSLVPAPPRPLRPSRRRRPRQRTNVYTALPTTNGQEQQMQVASYPHHTRHPAASCLKRPGSSASASSSGSASPANSRSRSSSTSQSSHGHAQGHGSPRHVQFKSPVFSVKTYTDADAYAEYEYEGGEVYFLQ